MEALTGVSIALLNIWDVVKMYEKDKEGQYPTTLIYDIKVEEKVKK
jgi:cyclic pyranopterin phosphate synthase